MSSPTRLAIVGMGKIAVDQHLPAVTDSDAFKLVATVDPSGDTSVAGVPSFSAMDELADSDIAVDAVSVCTPPQVRHDVAQDAIERGWHVLLEKPPGATMAEVAALRDMAGEAGTTLFTAWHSRYARAVEPARRWLEGRAVRSARITWREDVRKWHPGQDWIFEPGGFGVFDPGINALSIATHILARPFFVTEARLEVPANRGAPIAAEIAMRDNAGAPIAMDLDFLQEGPQSWDIEVKTDDGTLVLSEGGAKLAVDGSPGAAGDDALHGEYPALYARFAELLAAGRSDVGVAPLRLVADAFLRGRIVAVDAFDW